MKITVGIDEIPNRTPTLTPDTRTVLMADYNGAVFAYLQCVRPQEPDDAWEGHIVDEEGREHTVVYSASYEVAIALTHEARPTQRHDRLGYTSRPILYRVIYSNSLRVFGTGGQWRD